MDCSIGTDMSVLKSSLKEKKKKVGELQDPIHQVWHHN